MCEFIFFVLLVFSFIVHLFILNHKHVSSIFYLFFIAFMHDFFTNSHTTTTNSYVSIVNDSNFAIMYILFEYEYTSRVHCMSLILFFEINY